MRPAPLVLAATIAAFTACGDTELDERSREIAVVLSKADEPLIRSRPALAASKYAAMRSSLFAFYRGSFALYLHDAEMGAPISASAFPVEGLFPIGVGDAHPENFGLLLAQDGTFGLEPNDFDAADRYPYLWQLRRLTTGMVLATRSSNPEDPDALAAARAAEHEIARATAAGYAAAILAFDEGAALARIDAGGGDPNLDDLFERSAEDAAARTELVERTVLGPDGMRKLIRGAFDDPPKYYEDLPAVVRDALPDTVDRYRETLVSPEPRRAFRILDAAREYGSGIASLPKVRIAILIDGPTASPDDDRILELKELGDSGARGWGQPPTSADGPEQRIVLCTRTVWARPDAEYLWGTSSLLGLPVQLKGDFDAEKGVKMKRLTGDRATPEALASLGGSLGALLARADAAGSEVAPGTLAAIAAGIRRDPDGFALEQADVSVTYADVVERDYARFQKVVDELGPRLGIPVDPADTPPPDVAALFGSPPASEGP